jgi:hypothetical protein
LGKAGEDPFAPVQAHKFSGKGRTVPVDGEQDIGETRVDL